jgi:hypothetical protein
MFFFFFELKTTKRGGNIQYLMVEKSQVGVAKDHIVSISGVNDNSILDRAGSSSNVLDTRAMGTINGIGQLVHPFLTFLGSQRFRNSVEAGFPSLTFDTLNIKTLSFYPSFTKLQKKNLPRQFG